MAKANPVEFIQEVRDETAKVTWPSRKETLISTAMVLIMALAASLFFLGVDFVLKLGVDRVIFGF